MSKVWKKYLPTEMLSEIFKHLDTRSMLTVQFVSRHWRDVANFFIKNKTWIFHQSITETGLKWTSFPAKEIPSRYYHMSCIHHNQLVIFGGIIENKKKVDARNDLWTFDIPSHTWKLNKTTGQLPHKMAYGRMLSYNDKIFLVGGKKTSSAVPESETHSNDIYELDFKRLEWTLVKPKSRKPPLMSQHGANIWNDEIIVFGGINILTNHIGANEGDKKFGFDYHYYVSNDIYVFNLKTFKWRQVIVKGEAPSPRYGHSTFIYNDHLIVLGGAASCRKLFNDIWTLDMRKSDWNWRQIKCLKDNEPFNDFEIGCSPLAIFSNIIFGFLIFEARLEDYLLHKWSIFNEYDFEEAQKACKYFALDLTRIISDEVVDWQEPATPLVAPGVFGHTINTRCKEVFIYAGKDANEGRVSHYLTIGSMKQNRIFDLQMQKQPRIKVKACRNRRCR